MKNGLETGFSHLLKLFLKSHRYGGDFNAWNEDRLNLVE